MYDYEVEVKQTLRGHCWTGPVCNCSTLALTITMTELNESAADGCQQEKKKTQQKITKEVIFTCRSLRHTRKLHVLLLPGLKKMMKTSPFVQLKSCESGFLMEYFVYY